LWSGLARQYNTILCTFLLDLTSQTGFSTGGSGGCGDDKDNDNDKEDSAHNDNHGNNNGKTTLTWNG